MSSALDGVVVVDLTRETWGSLAGAMLGDFGARVVRVEDLGATPRDPDRDGRHPPEAIDALAELIHRNKQSVGLDLADDEGRAALHALVAAADVFLTDWSLADLAGLGLGGDDAKALRESLVYARGSGFGPCGPDALLPALDELAAARTGVMPTLPEPEQPPVYTGTGQMYTAVMLAFGVVAALHHREETGEGRLEMMQVLEGLFGQKPSDHWKAQFDEKRLSADIIERYDYPATHEQALRNRYVLDLEHPSYGRFRSLGFPIHMGGTPARLRGLAPCLGQHTAAVLGELLGWPDERVADLEARGVAGTKRAARERALPAAASVPTPPAEVVRVPDGPRPLDGVRVLDATVWFQGPVCAQLLADLGAEVIHIERPVTGDQARGVRSIAAVPVADWNQYFLCVNRNKKSLAVDLKSEGGRELMHGLAAKADVFLWNQGLESLSGLGLDYATLSAINPRLVYATNSGYGHAGDFNKPSFDMTVQALTGIMARQGEPGEPPIYLGLGAGDAYGGLMSALGVLLALHARRHTGRGQYIDASLYGAQLLLGAASLQPYLATGNEWYASQQSRKQARNPLWNRYQASDSWLFVCVPNADADWQRLCEAVGRADLAGDPRFASAEDRRENAAGLIVVLDEIFAARTAAEWTEGLRAADLAASPIAHFRDVADDPQAWANDYFVRAHCDEIGESVGLRGLPVTLGLTPGRVETLGPELGQDTEMILFELLGIDWDRIGELKEQGVIP